MRSPDSRRSEDTGLQDAPELTVLAQMGVNQGTVSKIFSLEGAVDDFRIGRLDILDVDRRLQMQGCGEERVFLSKRIRLSAPIRAGYIRKLRVAPPAVRSSTDPCSRVAQVQKTAVTSKHFAEGR